SLRLAVRARSQSLLDRLDFRGIPICQHRLLLPSRSETRNSCNQLSHKICRLARVVYPFERKICHVCPSRQITLCFPFESFHSRDCREKTARGHLDGLPVVLECVLLVLHQQVCEGNVVDRVRPLWSQTRCPF